MRDLLNLFRPTVRPAPAHHRRYDVGDGRVLTTRQIADLTGFHRSVIGRRVKRGERGTSLLRRKLNKSEAGRVAASNRVRRRYFVGDQWLTVREIAKATGCSESSVRARLARGWRGDALMEPRMSREEVARRATAGRRQSAQRQEKAAAKGVKP